MSRTGLLALVAFAAYALAVPSPPPDVPQECRPKPPAPGNEEVICCELPSPISMEKFDDVISECGKLVMTAHPNAEPPPHHGPPPTGPPKGDPHQLMIFEACVDECFFNKSGLLTPELKLNEAVISELIGQEIVSGSAWKPIVDKTIKTCLKNNGVKEEEDGCLLGPNKFMKCIMREMYLNCPSEIWQDKEKCKAEKQQIEKCPNLFGPPPNPPKKE